MTREEIVNSIKTVLELVNIGYDVKNINWNRFCELLREHNISFKDFE